MENAVINRATQKIDVNDFRTLTQLHIKYEWLQEEPDALFELLCLAYREEQKAYRVPYSQFSIYKWKRFGSRVQINC